MTISTAYSQSLSFAFSASFTSRISAWQRADTTSPQTPAPEPPPTGSAAPADIDRVELSPAATAGAPAVSPATPQRGDALFSVLDANKDGSITQQEFTEGAMALLRRAAARHRHHDHGEGNGDDRRVNWESRLADKLERVFGRVDANQDGKIDKDELAAALARTSPGREHGQWGDRPQEAGAERTSISPEGTSAAPTSVSVTQITVVAVAIQRYTEVGLSPSSDRYASSTIATSGTTPRVA